ncbi:MAG: hypothetical protein ACKUBY_03445 [Candidatus Moraniibacteriota bacterium]|jgi:hypothetical protein
MSKEVLNKHKDSDYERLIITVADNVHEKFKVIYKEKNNGTRIKATLDSNWIKKNGTNQVDLANLCYSDLPLDWKNERWHGSKVAFDEVLRVSHNSGSFNDKFVEIVSHLVHEDWLSRNMSRAEQQHQLPYKFLSEAAKEKDRIFVYAAIEIFNKNCWPYGMKFEHFYCNK